MFRRVKGRHNLKHNCLPCVLIKHAVDKQWPAVSDNNTNNSIIVNSKYDVNCIHLYIYIYTHTHIHIHIHIHVHTYIHKLHYIYMYTHTYIHTLHYITLHTYITLHYITWHYITLHYITLHTYIHTYSGTYSCCCLSIICLKVLKRTLRCRTGNSTELLFIIILIHNKNDHTNDKILQ